MLGFEMTSNARKTWISVLTCLAAIVAAEIVFRFSSTRAKIESEALFSSRLAHFESLPLDPDVVALGNSRVRHGFDTGVAESLLAPSFKRPVAAWNFGMGGVTGQTILALSLRLLERPRPPQVVLIFLMPTDLVSTTFPELAHLVLEQLWKPRDLAAVLTAGAPLEDALTVLCCSLFQTVRHRIRILDWVLRGRDLGPALGPDRNGFVPDPIVPPGLQHSRATARAGGYREESVGKNVSLSEFKLGCVEEAVRKLKAAGVKVILVNSPASSPISALANEKDSVVPLYLERIQQIATNERVPFFDHLAPSFLSDADYTDGDHLNFKGAAKYTTFLVNQAILPALSATDNQ